MVVIHRPTRRLKDTFQYTRSYDENRSQQRIRGRRVLSNKKCLRLPLNHRDSVVSDDLQISTFLIRSGSNNKVHLHDISLPSSSFAIKKKLTHDVRHDPEQSKLKTMLIDELKSFFNSRNQNYRPEQNHLNSVIDRRIEASTLTEKYPIHQIKHVNSVQQMINFRPTDANQVSPFNLLSDTLFYSLSFTFGCFGIQHFRQTNVPPFGAILTRSLLLHTCLTLFSNTKSSLRRTLFLPTSFTFTRPDILLRIVTSFLHLLAEFTMNFDGEDIL